MRIDAAGNVGIGMGSTAPAALLDVRPGSYASTLTTYATLGRFQFQSCTGCGADRIDHHKNSYVSKNTYGLVISSSATLGGSYTSTGDASIKFYYPSAGGGNQAGSQLEFWTNTNGYAGTTEARRMTIGSSGNVHIAATNNTDTAELTVDGDVRCTALHQTSDYRAKHAIVDLEVGDALSALSGLRPRVYTFKADGGRRAGFIAHELAEAGIPGAVNGAKDEVAEDGSPKLQSVDTSTLLPVLVRSLQATRDELGAAREQIAALAARLAALER